MLFRSGQDVGAAGGDGAVVEPHLGGHLVLRARVDAVQQNAVEQHLQHNVRQRQLHQRHAQRPQRRGLQGGQGQQGGQQAGDQTIYYGVSQPYGWYDRNRPTSWAIPLALLAIVGAYAVKKTGEKN